MYTLIAENYAFTVPIVIPSCSDVNVWSVRTKWKSTLFSEQGLTGTRALDGIICDSVSGFLDTEPV